MHLTKFLITWRYLCELGEKIKSHKPIFESLRLIFKKTMRVFWEVEINGSEIVTKRDNIKIYPCENELSEDVQASISLSCKTQQSSKTF